MTGAIIAAAVGVSAFALPYLAIVWLRARRARRARRRPSAAILDAEFLFRGLAFMRGEAHSPVGWTQVWPDIDCENDLCPYHFPCIAQRRPLCFNADCPLDGHPMTEALPS